MAERGALVRVVLAGAVALALAGCGGKSDSEKAADAVSSAQAQANSVLSQAQSQAAGIESQVQGQMSGLQAQASSLAAQASSAAAGAVDGKALFTATCGGCHTLKDAGTSGAVGPNLDDLKPDKATVVNQVNNGGGVMPAFKGKLPDDQIDAIATYVSSVAGA